MMRSPSAASSPKRRQLASAAAALFALSAPAVHATAFVTNCNDAGAGSLRAAMIAAASGDTVDATGLAGVCSTITLTTGQISIAQTNLKIVGPGKSNLLVTAAASATSRLVRHSGSGALEFDDIALGKGYQLGSGTVDAFGGCIFSNGNVTLKNANVTLCTAKAPTGPAVGGAIYAQGSVYLLNSVVSGNSATAGASSGGSGGGIFARSGVTAKYSTISNNTASNATNDLGSGGGLFTQGSSIVIHHTTISGNQARQYDGGMIAIVTGTATLFDDTISNNRALHGATGGGYISANILNLYNTTIAENTAYSGFVNLPAGLAVRGTGASPTLQLESTLLANNTYGMTPSNNDFFNSGFTIAGHNNLIRASSSSLPADTIVGQCPLLGPLKSNGGSTQTHALYSRSPAIDMGNNRGSLAYDQRGPPYVRASGPPGTASPRADIGAFEVNQLDVVFNAGFEGCP